MHDIFFYANNGKIASYNVQCSICSDSYYSVYFFLQAIKATENGIMYCSDLPMATDVRNSTHN